MEGFFNYIFVGYVDPFYLISGIPTLVMLSEDNEVICHNARSSVFNDLEAKVLALIF